MAQVSYGTITITDTNDIERIYMEYAQSSSNSTAPTTGWSENIPAWEQGKYIWQRTVVKKEGVALSSDSYGDPVCLTGSTGSTGSPGATGRGVSSIVTTYCNYATGTPAANYSGWSSTVPTYDSTKPNYWIKTVITYTSGTPATDTKIYQDNGITSATATAASAKTQAAAAEDKADTAVSTANTANTNASNALNIANGVNQHFWWIASDTATTGGTIAAGAYITDIAQSTFKTNPSNYGNLLLRSDGVYLNLGLQTLASFKSNALTFYNSAGTELGKFGSTGLEMSGTLNIKGGGRIGQDSDNYWEFGDNRSYNDEDSAYLIGKGTASIQLGETGHWRLDKNRIHTGWYQLSDSSSSTPAGSLHFDTGVDGNSTYYWDYGMHYPNKAGNGNNKFLYIRRSNDTTSTTLATMKGRIDNDDYWTYKFYIDGNGNVHAPGFYIGDSTTPIGGGAGTVAERLTQGYGSSTQPIYFNSNGVPTNTTYALNAAGAKGVDTSISAASTSTNLPTSQAVAAFVEGKGYITSYTDNKVQTSQANTTKIYLAGTSTAGTSTGTLNFDSNVYLTTTAGTLHATTFEGNLSGTATKANQDGDGNVIKSTYLKLSGGNVTGAVTFGSSVSVDELMAGDLVVNGNASFTNNLQANTINGVAVGSSPKFTDTVTTVTVTGNGNAVTSASASNGAVTLTKGTTFPTGSGTNGYLTKWTGASTIGNGPQLGSSTTTFLRNDGTWDTPVGSTYTAGNGLRLNGSQFINTRIPFVAGTQTEATGSWTGVCNDITTLYDGLTIAYWLPYAGSGNATLNLTINGTATGAKNCYYNGTNRLTTHFGAGNVIYLTYRSSGNINGTNYEGWWANANYDSNDTGYYHRRIYPNMKAGSNKIYPYTLIMQLPDGRWESLVTSNSTGTSKAKNTHGFLLGHILLMYYNETYTENQNISTYRIWSAHTGLIDHRYSFNTANDSTNGTTGYKPIYLVGSLGSDGLFYLADKWWTQTLPTTADGKIYIYIGDAYDYYRMTLTEDKPMYVYTNGKLREFSQDAATITGYTVAKDVPSNAVFTDTWKALSTSQAGYVAQAPNDTGKFLRGDAQWAAVTKSNVGLGNVTNNAQVKGLSSGTTSGHLVTWGADGYTVADSGITKGNIVKSVGSNNNGQLVLTYADDSTSSPIDVTFVATIASSATLADALNVDGTAVGSATVPVYFDNQGKPQTANTIPKLNNTTTGGTFYAPTAGGTADTQALVGNGATTAPKWVNISPSISITAGTGSATPKINVTVLGRSGTAQSLTTASTSVYGATKLSSISSSTEQGLAATPKLVYDSIAALDVTAETGTQSQTITSISETDGKISVTYSDISITKSQISDFPTSMTPAAHNHSQIVTVGDQRSTATTPNSYSNALIFQGLKSKATVGSPSDDTYSYIVGLRGWSDSSGGNSHELAFNNTGIFWRQGATTSWGNWYRIYTTGNKPTASDVGLGNVTNYDSSVAIKSITRSGTTFTYTTVAGNTGTFTQQDNNTWDALSTSQAGYVAKAPNDTGKFLRGDASWAAVTKANVGLGNVENTALSTWTGTNKITTLGTITTGTWNGSAVPVANGGTGATTAANARTNLGLGSAATASTTTSIASGGTGLPTAGTVYTYVTNAISGASNTYVTIATDQTITANQKTFNGAIRWGTASKYGAVNYDSTLEALVFSFI